MSKPFEYDKVKEKIGAVAGVGLGAAGLDIDELKGALDAGEAGKDVIDTAKGVLDAAKAGAEAVLPETGSAGEMIKDVTNEVVKDVPKVSVEDATKGAKGALFDALKIDTSKHFDPKVFGNPSFKLTGLSKSDTLNPDKVNAANKEADERAYEMAIRDTASDKFIKEIAEQQGISVESLTKAIVAQEELGTMGQAYLATNEATSAAHPMQTMSEIIKAKKAAMLYQEKMSEFDNYVENKDTIVKANEVADTEEKDAKSLLKKPWKSLFKKDDMDRDKTDDMESIYNDAKASVDEYITARTAMDAVKDKLPKDIYTAALNGLSEKYPAAKTIAENYPQSDEAYIARGQEIPDKKIEIESPVLGPDVHIPNFPDLHPTHPGFPTNPGHPVHPVQPVQPVIPGHGHAHPWHTGPAIVTPGFPSNGQPVPICKDLGDSANWATSKVAEVKDVVETAIDGKEPVPRKLDGREIPEVEGVTEGTEATKDMSLE